MLKTDKLKTDKFFIDGAWVKPKSDAFLDVVNPATEEVITRVALGNSEDVDAAVAAAKSAFATWSQTTPQERLRILEAVAVVYARRTGEMAAAVSQEMGAPLAFATQQQVPIGLSHLEEVLKILRTYEFQQVRGPVTLVREPVGVCALITPWNWPLNQILCKVAPALAAGCTVVLKPSELAPLNAVLFAEVLEEAGVPRGVFNMVHGTGEGVGVPLSRHPDVDTVSFTGSTRAGIEVSKNAADTIKRVTLELGGKAANIVLSDADLAKSATNALKACFINSGQTCIAPSRILVQKEQVAEFAKAMREAIKAFPVGDPNAESTVLGPVASVRQYEKIQGLIKSGLDEGAELLTGGLGRPSGLNRGYYIQPTVFVKVDPSMTVAREGIFGPVMCIIPYEDEADAIRIANDSVYGLGGGVQSADRKRAFRVASQIRTGVMMINDATPDLSAPFGGYKQSGNGREWGHFGFEEFLEVKTVMGYQEAS